MAKSVKIDPGILERIEIEINKFENENKKETQK